MKHKKPLVADVIADLEKHDAVGAPDSSAVVRLEKIALVDGPAQSVIVDADEVKTSHGRYVDVFIPCVELPSGRKVTRPTGREFKARYKFINGQYAYQGEA